MALTIYPEDYLGRMVDYCMMKIYALIRVKETNQTWSDEDDFVLEKPKLKVEVTGGGDDGAPRRHRLCRVEVRVPNPLPVALTGCRVSLECAGVVRKTTEKLGELQPNTTVVERVK